MEKINKNKRIVPDESGDSSDGEKVVAAVRRTRSRDDCSAAKSGGSGALSALTGKTITTGSADGKERAEAGGASGGGASGSGASAPRAKPAGGSAAKKPAVAVAAAVAAVIAAAAGSDSSSPEPTEDRQAVYDSTESSHDDAESSCKMSIGSDDPIYSAKGSVASSRAGSLKEMDSDSSEADDLTPFEEEMTDETRWRWHKRPPGKLGDGIIVYSKAKRGPPVEVLQDLDIIKMKDSWSTQRRIENSPKPMGYVTKIFQKENWEGDRCNKFVMLKHYWRPNELPEVGDDYTRRGVKRHIRRKRMPMDLAVFLSDEEKEEYLQAMDVKQEVISAERFYELIQDGVKRDGASAQMEVSDTYFLAGQYSPGTRKVTMDGFYDLD